MGGAKSRRCTETGSWEMGVLAWSTSACYMPSGMSHPSLCHSLPIYKRRDWREGFWKDFCILYLCFPNPPSFCPPCPQLHPQPEMGAVPASPVSLQPPGLLTQTPTPMTKMK